MFGTLPTTADRSPSNSVSESVARRTDPCAPVRRTAARRDLPGRCGSGSQLTRLFGGLVLAQALAPRAPVSKPAARPHSLHAYFLRPGHTEEPVRYRVESLRDGRAFTTHRVTAEQAGRPILTMIASFHVPESGLAHQITAPDAPDPHTLRSVHDCSDTEPVIYREWPWIDLRRCPALTVPNPPVLASGAESSNHCPTIPWCEHAHWPPSRT